jgi:hypothetical protein
MFDRSHNGCINYLQDWILTLISLRGKKVRAICNIEIYREAMPYNINWIESRLMRCFIRRKMFGSFAIGNGGVIEIHSTVHGPDDHETRDARRMRLRNTGCSTGSPRS